MLRFHDPRVVPIGAAGLAWLVLTGGASAADDGVETASDQGRLELAVDAGVLTLQARDVPLADVLAAIGQRAGFDVSVKGDANTPISVVLAAVPLEEALRQLLREGSYAFLYDKSSVYPARRIVKVHVYAFEEASAVVERDEAVTLEPEVSATPGEPMRQDDEAAPLISPHDPLEDRLEFTRIEARGAKPTSATDLITLLREDEYANVRGLAAAALGRLGGAEAGEALAEALSDRDRRVRRRATRALGQAWGHQAVEPLSQLLMEERARSVRRVAAYTLSRINSAAAVQALEPLQYDLDPRVRRIAALALERAKD